MQYKRLYIPGATYFFTVVTHNRCPIFNSKQNIFVLKKAFLSVLKKHPFTIDAIVVLPDHIHCIWTMPKNDSDYAKRWRLIKTWFTKHCDKTPHDYVNHSRLKKSSLSIWQNRYWEHMIRDEKDLTNHIAYIHYNPVKHGYVKSVSDYPYSSFFRYVERGLIDENWGEDVQEKEFDGIGKE